METMKYFISLQECLAFDRENLVEFYLPTAEKEFWDETSLYLSQTALQEMGVLDFWSQLMHDDIVFDVDSMTKEDMERMVENAQSAGDPVLSVITELKAWADPHLAGDQYIGVVWPYERNLYLKES